MNTIRGATIVAAMGVLVLTATDAAGQAAEETERTRDEVVRLDATKGRDLDKGQWILVNVSNTIQPAQTVIVSVISPTRPEYVLGTVPPGEKREWKIDTRLYVGGVRFLASSGPRGVNLVNSIRAVDQARALWNLGLNFMRYQRVEDTDTEGDAALP
ncbi:MAG: hypothetical protein OEU54_02275 [Gemmatimonadota bacterium]|nr:hypothetical protein [Gemmatimonadota bacterium]